jgi:hypothetical protein
MGGGPYVRRGWVDKAEKAGNRKKEKEEKRERETRKNKSRPLVFSCIVKKLK